MTTILDAIRAQAQKHPDRIAIREGEPPPLRYGELVRRFEERSAELFRETGWATGQRCGLLADNQSRFLVEALAILDAGFCLVPLQDDPTPGPLTNALALQGVVDARGSGTPDVTSRAGGQREADERVRDLNPAYVRFTSGTTGRRKGVLLSHSTILDRTETVNRSLRISREDRVLWLLSMDNHFISSVLLYLRNGATILVPDRNLAKPMLDFAREHDATFVYGTPYQYRLLAEEDSGRSLGPVRRCISTATGLSESLATRFQERYRRPLTQALGIIEVGLPVINLKHPGENPLAVGQVQPGYEVRLRPSGDQEAGGTESGEIRVRGPGLFDAYLSPWTPASEVLQDGFFPTGDQGRWDGRGDLRISGRRANRINMAGKKFFCEEVERILNTHPGVKASRVFARSHSRLGEVPEAEIVPSDGSSNPDSTELRSHCAQFLPSYKVPLRFEPVESLPRTPTGKIRRSAPSE